MVPSQFRWTKDPQDIVDYSIDWVASPCGMPGIAFGDTIEESTWFPSDPAGLTIVHNSCDGSTASVRISGGTEGTTYRLTNRVVLKSGQQFDQTVEIKVATR